MTLVKVILFGAGFALHVYRERRPWFAHRMGTDSWVGFEPFVGFEAGCPWLFVDGYITWRC